MGSDKQSKSSNPPAASAAWTASPLFGLLISAGVYFLLTQYAYRLFPAGELNLTRGTILMDVRRVKQPYIYGVNQLRTLAAFEERIYNIVHNSGESRMVSEPLQAWVTDYEATSHLALSKRLVKSVSDHPTLVYRLLRRFNTQFRTLTHHLGREGSRVEKQILGAIIKQQLHLQHDWPDQEDVDDAMRALLRLQDVYGLSVAEIVYGKFLHISTEVVALSMAHVLEVAQFAIDTQQFVLALEWLQCAYNQTATLSGLLYIQSQIQQLLHAHKEAWDHDIEQEFVVGTLNRLTPGPTMKSLEMKKINHTGTAASELLDYYKLCGQSISSQREFIRGKNAGLKCWLGPSSKSSDWFLTPAKMEELSSDPSLVKIYDVIGPKAATRIQDLTLNSAATQYVEVYIPKTHSEDNSKPRYFRGKTCSGSLLPNKVDPIVRVLSRRLSYLVVDTQRIAGEPLDAFSYGPGGHYDVHHDAPDEYRHATVQIYFDRPLLGGHIVFPRLGTTVQPDPGSVLLLYNLRSDGSPDERLRHGTCPVVLGHMSGAIKHYFTTTSDSTTSKTPK